MEAEWTEEIQGVRVTFKIRAGRLVYNGQDAGFIADPDIPDVQFASDVPADQRWRVATHAIASLLSAAHLNRDRVRVLPAAGRSD